MSTPLNQQRYEDVKRIAHEGLLELIQRAYASGFNEGYKLGVDDAEAEQYEQGR